MSGAGTSAGGRAASMPSGAWRRTRSEEASDARVLARVVDVAEELASARNDDGPAGMACARVADGAAAMCAALRGGEALASELAGLAAAGREGLRSFRGMVRLLAAGTEGGLPFVHAPAEHAARTRGVAPRPVLAGPDRERLDMVTRECAAARAGARRTGGDGAGSAAAVAFGAAAVAAARGHARLASAANDLGHREAGRPCEAGRATGIGEGKGREDGTGGTGRRLAAARASDMETMGAASPEAYVEWVEGVLRDRGMRPLADGDLPRSRVGLRRLVARFGRAG